MDVQAWFVCVALVVVSVAVILLVSMFGMKEKTYEEAIAEQRKFPDDLLLGKKEKGKEKKHKNKAGKKVKEKKEEKEEKEDDRTEHVHFEEALQVLPTEPLLQEDKSGKGNKKRGKGEKVKPILVNKDEPVLLAPELSPSQPPPEEVNHFDLIQPKDDLELIRSHSRDNLQQLTQSEPAVNKSPKDTPTKSKKNAKDAPKRKDEIKEEKKEVTVSVSAPQQQLKESAKEVKEQQKETPVKEIREKETAAPVQSSAKESKSKKKKNDILAQIGGDKDGVNVSLLMPLVQKAELSRSEIQILIDQLLNKQLDNPLEHSEWSEGRADPVIKLKKQLSEKEKALADEQEASVAFQNKLKELRAELNSERSRLSTAVRQLEEALSTKVMEAQTLHTRMQHILESHAAEKQGFARQIEQLQTKVNEDAAIIHKMQEDQGQTQGHMQQELIAQRKQLEVQFAQMRENENALKTQLAQKHIEVKDLQNVNRNISQELQAAFETSTAEIERLRQESLMMQEQMMHSEGQLQHFKEAGDRIQDLAGQLEDSHRANADLEHRLQNAHRHEQDLQKQINSLKSELNTAKTGANEAASLKAELLKVQTEFAKLKSDLSLSQNEAKSEAVVITTLKNQLSASESELKKSQSEFSTIQEQLKKSQAENSTIQGELIRIQEEYNKSQSELAKIQGDLKQAQNECTNVQSEYSKLQQELSRLQGELRASNETAQAELERRQLHQNLSEKFDDTHLQAMRLQEENDRLSAQLGSVVELQKEVKQLRDENESLSSQLAATTVRPAAEGRENGVEEKAQKNNIQLVEHNNLVAQKENQLDALRTELAQKETELSKLTMQVEALRSDVNNQRTLAARLQDDLEAQRAKNNELRTKNWKVMEALSAAESRNKSNPGKSIDEWTQKVRLEEQESSKVLLQRIFPDIKVSEDSHDKWLSAFEERVSAVLDKLRKESDGPAANLELEKQNQSLQGKVIKYKQIIDVTEGMLNKLQSQIESEETRWQEQIGQKENEVANLRVELNDVRNKAAASEKLQQKITELEATLLEKESFRVEAKTALADVRSTFEFPPAKGGHSHDLAALEQLQEEKARLSQELQSESNRRATLDAEVAKLRSLVETSESSLVQEKSLVSQLQQEVTQLKSEVCGGSSSSDQSTLNGPPTSDSPKSEPALAAQSLIAALEKTLLKNTELANCSITEPVDSVQCQDVTDDSSLTSKISPKTCHTTDHNTQANWNPLNGQQHKKHKKKKKSSKKPTAKRRRFAGWFRKKVTLKNKLR